MGTHAIKVIYRVAESQKKINFPEFNGGIEVGIVRDNRSCLLLYNDVPHAPV